VGGSGGRKRSWGSLPITRASRVTMSSVTFAVARSIPHKYDRETPACLASSRCDIPAASRAPFKFRANVILRSAEIGRRVTVTTTLVLGWVVSWKASPSIAVKVAGTLSLINEIRHQPLPNLRLVDPTRPCVRVSGRCGLRPDSKRIC
jgi:hypothetical protein